MIKRNKMDGYKEQVIKDNVEEEEWNFVMDESQDEKTIAW